MEERKSEAKKMEHKQSKGNVNKKNGALAKWCKMKVKRETEHWHNGGKEK